MMELHHTVVAAAVEVALFDLEKRVLVAYPSFAVCIGVAKKKKTKIKQLNFIVTILLICITNKLIFYHTCCNKCLRPGLLDITGRICILCCGALLPMICDG